MTTVSQRQAEPLDFLKRFAVDGAAWHNMMRLNGAERTNHTGLVGVVRKLRLELPFVQRPRSTIHPSFHKEGGDLYESMRRAGMLPRAAESFGERDDQLVMKWLSRWVAREDVVSIVVATCDGEIIDFLLDAVSARRWSKGHIVLVDVIGTCTLDEDDNCPMCRDVLRDIRRLPLARFHDVRDFQQHVEQTPLTHH